MKEVPLYLQLQGRDRLQVNDEMCCHFQYPLRPVLVTVSDQEDLWV